MTNEYNTARFVLELLNFFGFASIDDLEKVLSDAPELLDTYKTEIAKIRSAFGLPTKPEKPKTEVAPKNEDPLDSKIK